MEASKKARLQNQLLTRLRRRELAEAPIPTAFANGHFYSSIVNPAEVDPRRVWPQDPQVLGVDFHDNEHLHVLCETFPRYIADYDYPEHLEETPDLAAFY